MNFFFLEEKEFQPMASTIDDTLYHQTKKPIGFLCRWGLNPKSLIQLSEILPVMLTRTHYRLNL